MKKRFEYPIIGIIISFILFIVGIITDIGVCFTAGIVFFFCNIGTLIGVYLREKNSKKIIFVVLLVIAIVLTIFFVRYFCCLKVK